MNKAGKEGRKRLADYLLECVYEFLCNESQAENRHVLIAGDFNAEPYYPEMQIGLNSYRDRSSARKKLQHSDHVTKRAMLYNSSWRMLGENQPFAGDRPEYEIAGTYYWAKRNQWATFDHVVVDGSLLENECPFFDERNLEILTDAVFLDPNESKPTKFQWDGSHGNGGISDHLPIRGRIVLSKESKK